jgi:hypothetical protein
MDTEVEQVVNAINGLKEDNLLKDYVFPIASAFFMAILGGFVAYFSFLRQEKIQANIARLHSTNKWTLIGLSALESLKAIKSNYYERLTDDPVLRALEVPTIFSHANSIAEDIHELAFIVPSKLKGDMPKWSQITRIQVMIKNYNQLLIIWNLRNEIAMKVKPILVTGADGKPYANLTLEEIFFKVNPIDLTNFIDINEKALKLTDDLIIELEDFVHNFSRYVEFKIWKSVINNYGPLIKYYHNQDQSSKKYLNRCVAPNHKKLSILLEISEEEVRARYETGYMDI